MGATKMMSRAVACDADLMKEIGGFTGRMRSNFSFRIRSA